jgi:hypothetical protein
MTLQLGSRGKEVRELQLWLKALHFDPGDIDGIFGKRTRAALIDFQEQYESLADTGILDAETEAAIEQALVIRDSESPDVAQDSAVVPCAPEIWTAFLGLVETVTKTPVRYGPGRGLFKDGHWVITYGPGGLNRKAWPCHRSKCYPSFHCTSWTNFFLGWLLRYNEDFTHAGNIPSLFALLEKSRDLHAQKEGGAYRGYGPYVTEIVSNGSTLPRKKQAKVLDIRELYERRKTLPTFLVCGQSTHTVNGWKWWHHTVVFAVDHSSPDAPMYRIAADGFKDSRGYSGKAMEWIEIDADAFSRFDNAIYRVYGVNSSDGRYGGDRPIASVTLEP